MSEFARKLVVDHVNADRFGAMGRVAVFLD
jgi:hypothetical protein